MSGSFIGYFDNCVSNNRITIPAKFQKKFSVASKKTVVVTLGYGQPHIVIFPFDYWTALENKLKKGTDIQSGNLDSYLDYALEQQLEGPGRIRLQQELLDLTGIVKEVIIKGEGSFISLWEPNIYRQNRDKKRQELITKSNRSDFLL